MSTKSARELARCAPHGLTYDPAANDGCTLCRKAKGPAAREDESRAAVKTAAMIAIMALWVSGVLYGGYFMLQGAKAAVLLAAASARASAEPPPMPLPPSAAGDDVALLAAAPEGLPLLRRPGVDPFGAPRDAVDELGFLTLLRQGRFPDLTRYMEELQREFDGDVRKEEWIIEAGGAFDTADPVIGALLDEWVRASPASFAPYLARAHHRVAVAWYYRGTGFSAEMGADRMTKFRELVTLAEPDLTRAVELNPRLVAAHALRVWVATNQSKEAEGRAALDTALRTCPACFRVRSRYLVTLLPRWGGSYAKMEEFAVKAQAEVGKNPKLKALLGYADDDRCDGYLRDKKLPAALEACDRALGVADFHRFHETRASVLEAMGRPVEALAAIERAVDQAPFEYDYLRDRADLRLQVGQLDDGVHDLRLMRSLDPTSDGTRRAIERGVKWLVKAGHEKQQAGDPGGAVAAFDLALSVSPGNEEALQRKQLAQARLGVSTEVAQLEAATRADPTDFESFAKLDAELLKTREFERIVQHWDRYLAAKPDDARGYLERGGALFHAGHHERAVTDLRRACAAGLERGCQGARHVQSRAP